MNDIYSLTVRSHVFCSRSTFTTVTCIKLLDDWCQGNYSATDVSVC